MSERWGDSQRDRDALDRHITGNYGEDQFKGEGGEYLLSSKEIKDALVGNLNDLWIDNYRQGNPTFQLKTFCGILQDAVYLATNLTVKVEP